MMFFIYCVGLLVISITEVELSVEIAHGKHVTSTRPYIVSGHVFASELAVDGNTNNNLLCLSCLHTSGDRNITEAFFTIDFNGNYTIDRVEIFYRDDYINTNCPSTVANSIASNYRFKGYSILISSTRNWRNGITCYRDESNPYPDLHVNNTCIGTGSYLTIYDNHTYKEGRANAPVLELCEVKVYGCLLGHFGHDCNSSCSNCKDDTCDLDDGTCQTYCKDGWQGVKCDLPCPPRFHGQNCSTPCRYCINMESCNCPHCARGFYGNLCDKECENKTYGYNCSNTCGNCFQLNACNKLYGYCEKGCDKGYNGLLCKTVCNANEYGYNCNETCGHCKESETCNTVSGYCRNGCAPGWTGKICKQVCRNGTYGNNCENTCGHCLNDEYCDIYDGTCKHGCSAGWRDETCKQVCRNGTYGKNCEVTCGHCLNYEYCDKYDGTCKNGCTAEWKDKTCKEGISYKVPFVVVSVICSILVLSNIIVIVICLRRNGRFQWRKSNQHKDPCKDNYELPISGITNEHNYDHVENQTPEYSEIGNDAISPDNSEQQS